MLMVSLFNTQTYHDILLPVIKATKFGVPIYKIFSTKSDIRDGFKKFSLLFRQANMIFVIVWFLDHFTLEYVPSMNSICIITPAGLLHVWITKFQTFFIFFKTSIMTSTNVVWVSLFAILFNEDNTLSKYPRRGTCLFFMRSLIHLLSLKIFC